MTLPVGVVLPCNLTHKLLPPWSPVYKSWATALEGMFAFLQIHCDHVLTGCKMADAPSACACRYCFYWYFYQVGHLRCTAHTLYVCMFKPLFL